MVVNTIEIEYWFVIKFIYNEQEFCVVSEKEDSEKSSLVLVWVDPLNLKGFILGSGNLSIKWNLKKERLSGKNEN